MMTDLYTQPRNAMEALNEAIERYTRAEDALRAIRRELQTCHLKDSNALLNIQAITEKTLGVRS